MSSQAQAAMAGWRTECRRWRARLRATPHPKSGTAAQSARLRQRRIGREETPHVRGQRRRPRGATQHLRPVAAGKRHPRLRGQGRPGEATSRPRPAAVTLRSHTEPRGQGRQLGGATLGAVAEQAQEGLEELSHVEGQERWW